MKASTAVQQNKRRAAAIFTAVVALLLSIGLVIFNDRYLLQPTGSAEYPHFRILFRVISMTGACTVILVAVLGILRRWSVTRLLPLAVSVLGALFLFVIPPLAEPDGITHFGMAYRNAATLNGVQEPTGDFSWVIAMRPQDAAGIREIRSPQGYEDWLSDFSPKKNELTDHHAVAVLGETDEPHGYTVTAAIQYNSNGAYYCFSSLAMAIGLAFGLSFNWISLLGCMANLVVYILSVSYAVRKLPFGRRAFAIVTLLPISLQQAASFSYDSVLLSASAVVVALGLRWSTEDHRFGLTRSDIMEYVAFAVGAYFLLIIKNPTYAVLILFPFLCNIKKEIRVLEHVYQKYLSRHRARRFLAIIVVVVLMAAAVWYAVRWLHGSLYQYPYVPDYGVRKIRPIDYLRQPGATFLMILKSIAVWGREWIYELFGGCLGMLNRRVSSKLMYAVVLLFMISLIRTDAEPVPVISHRIAGAILALISDVISIVAMMFFFTRDIDHIIRGVQGRYFLPTLFLLAISLFYWRKPVLESKYRNRMQDRILGILGLKTNYLDAMLMILMVILVLEVALKALIV